MELKCQYCGLNVDLPFRCPFCGGYFCADHRLPEFHACQGMRRGTSPPEYFMRRGFDEDIRIKPVKGHFSRFFESFRNLFGSRELIHISLGTLMVVLVGLSIAINEARSPSLQSILFFALILVSAVIPHELAHKFTAKHYGLWAEFRLSLIGVIITLISMLFPIKIVSPGAVIISGEATRKTIGKVSLSGPLVNVSLAVVFLALSSVSSVKLLEIVFAQGSMINAFAALFNLIPFGVLDGAKILWWNKYFWAVAFLASLMLVAVNLIILY